MVNIVYLWDFEDGTTQGWELSIDYATLDDGSKVQGTYSIKYSRLADSGDINVNDLVAKVTNIDLSGVKKPLLLLIVKDESDHERANKPGNIEIVVRDGDGNVLANYTIQLADNRKGWTRVVVVDMIDLSGQSNLTIELYERGTIGHNYTRTHYFDVIAIVDGADYELAIFF